MAKDRFLIAQIGKTVGLKGDLKFHIYTDFPEQFKNGVTLSTDSGDLTIFHYDKKRDLIRFENYDTPELARKLTNTKIYSDKEKSKELCELREGEFFWFDIIGLNVFEGDLEIGKVKDIQRLQGVDYLMIKTSGYLESKGCPRTFLLPYIAEKYIISVDLQRGRIFTNGAMDILEAS